jgi:diguanylate cyclase (GGDEF)-like protein
MVLAGPSSVGRVFLLEKPLVIGRSYEADIWVDDRGASRKHAEVRPEPKGVILRDMGSRNGTFCNGTRVERKMLEDGDKIQLGLLTRLKFTYLDLATQRLQNDLYESATRDALTAIHNQRFLREALLKDFARALRHRLHLSLLLIDLDHFKRVNDTHGHASGDRVLKHVARILQGPLRAEDLLARYGGEEFVIVLKECNLANATVVAERLRKLVADSPIEIEDGKKVQITLSVGIASLPNARCGTIEALLELADKNLYRAKEGGRNRVWGVDAP